jgi:amidase
VKLSEYTEYDAVGLAELLARGEVTAAEVAAAALDAVAAVDGELGAVIETWTPVAPATGPLSGVPFLVKDLGVSYAGQLSEAGSRLAAGNRAGVTSVLAQRFLDAGLVPVGRTTTPEWAWNTETESVAVGITRNPWDLGRTPGGSSGGSAAAVAAGIVPLAHATDAAGSIRIPAACSGLVGLKPTRGRVSNGPFLDEAVSHLAAQLGLSRTVRDTAALLDAVCAPDPGAPFATPGGTGSYLAATAGEPAHLRIGVLAEPWGGDRPSAAVSAAVRRAASLCRDLGHDVVEATVDLGVSWEEFVRHSSVLWAANIATWIADTAAATGRPIDETTLEPQTLAVYRTGQTLSALDVVRALDTRNLVTRTVVSSMADLDLVLTPTLPTVAAPLGTNTTDLDDLDGHDWTQRLFAHSPFTPWANTAGLPAISVPLDHDEATGMPIGIQFVGAAGREDLVLALAGQLERSAPWSHRRPAVWAGRSGR